MFKASLSRWEEEVDGEVVVGVGGVVVDPELPQDRSQRSRSHQNTTDQERLGKINYIVYL